MGSEIISFSPQTPISPPAVLSIIDEIRINLDVSTTGQSTSQQVSSFLCLTIQARAVTTPAFQSASFVMNRSLNATLSRSGVIYCC